MANNVFVSGFPDTTNTGVPDGVTLTSSGSIVVTKAGTVLRGLDIKGDIYVAAPNVTIENCRITSGSWQGINTSEDAAGLVVKNCDIDGQGKVAGSYGIMGTGTFTGNDIRGFENGIGVVGSNAVIKGNYIHDLQSPGDPHYDGIAIQGGQSSVLIEDNTILGRDTADIFIKNDFGPITDITVNHNYLGGDPGYNIYVDGRASGGPITDVSITNNYVDKGFYGTYAIDRSMPVVSGNVEFDGGSGNLPQPPSGGPAPAPAPTTPTVPSPEGPDAGASPLHHLVGTISQDWLRGGDGSDRIVGNAGNDALFGGAGADIFDFNRISDSPVGFGKRDLIHDFQHGIDQIDLSDIDAVSGVRGNQTFTFLGEGLFDAGADDAGQLKFHFESINGVDRTIVEGTSNNEPGVDFQISLVGHVGLSSGDFIL